MNENKIVNFSSATQLKNFVWDSLSYDISESFVETLSEENKEINKLKNTASKMFNNIVMIEKELKKIEKEKEEDEDVKESKAVFELERALVEELADLKRRYSKVSKRLNEAMGSVPLPSVGDTVKVRGKGTGTILSVDGVDKKFIVLLNNGETIQCIDKDINIVESMIKRSDTSSPEADLSIIQGSNARPSGKHGEAKKMMKESFNMSEDVDTLDDVVTIPMDDVKGMITDPSNVVKHSEFGATYEEDIENFDEMAERGNRDYYPEDDEKDVFSMDDDMEVDEVEEEIEETEDMEEEVEEVEEVEEGYNQEDDYRDWDEMDPESDDYYGDDDDDFYDDDEDFDDEDFDDEDFDDEDFDDEEDSSLYGVMTDRYGTPGGYGIEEANDEEKEMEEGDEEVDEDIQSVEMDMEMDDESDLHNYERRSRDYPGYGSRQTVFVDPSSDNDYEIDGEYDDDIQFEENEENDELLGSYGGSIEED
jgi:hypothetical protein